MDEILTDQEKYEEVKKKKNNVYFEKVRKKKTIFYQRSSVLNA